MRVQLGLFAVILAMVATVNGARADEPPTEPKIQITSFVMSGQSTRAAELCGRVTGLTQMSVVKVIVDHTTHRPGTYYSLVGVDGKFCLALNTLVGRASASIVHLGREIAGESVSVSESSAR